MDRSSCPGPVLPLRIQHPLEIHPKQPSAPESVSERKRATTALLLVLGKKMCRFRPAVNPGRGESACQVREGGTCHWQVPQKS